MVDSTALSGEETEMPMSPGDEPRADGSVEAPEADAQEGESGPPEAETVPVDSTRADGPEDTSGSTFSAPAAWALAICLSAVIASGVQVGSQQPDRGFFLLTLCFAICAAAAWIDVATRRIPNVLTYPAILIGIAVNSLLPLVMGTLDLDVVLVWTGSTGFMDGMLGFGVCALVGIISFAARGLGGGDVKLVAAVGALLGLSQVVGVLVNALVIAGIMGLINWAARGTLVPRMQVLARNMLAAIFTGEGLKNVYPFGRSEAPFGLALLLGLALAQVFQIHQWLLVVGWPGGGE